MSFLIWLLQQASREDPIGSLARDARRISRDPKIWRGEIPPSWRTLEPEPDMETFKFYEDEGALELALREYFSRETPEPAGG